MNALLESKLLHPRKTIKYLQPSLITSLRKVLLIQFCEFINVWHEMNCKGCGSNAFQDYFDDAKESRVKQIPKIQERMHDNKKR